MSLPERRKPRNPLGKWRNQKAEQKPKLASVPKPEPQPEPEPPEPEPQPKPEKAKK